MSLSAQHVSVFYYSEQILRDISIEIEPHTITAITGPSNAGKTTFLKLFNRLNETQRGYRVEGNLMLEGDDLTAIPLGDLRRRCGYLFPQPYALPGTVLDNLAFGLQIQGVQEETAIRQKAMEMLENFGLWVYFRDDLHTVARKLTPFKSQLLALARILMLDPEVLLMEQPTKHLSEMSARKLEAIIIQLKKRHTILIDSTTTVQAQRISDRAAFFYNGSLIEYSPTREFFTQPQYELTENFIRGKFEL